MQDSQVQLLRADSIDDLTIIRSDFLDELDDGQQPIIRDVQFDGDFYIQEITVVTSN